MIHSTAIVDSSASLAGDVEVGPYSIIGAGVEIDSGCRIAPHVVIRGPIKIGKNNQIFQFSSLGEVPQDLKYKGEDTQVIIGDDNIIRESVTINRGTAEGEGVTVVGDHNLLMAYTHVAHDCHIGHHTVFANSSSLAGHVRVGDYAVLGGFTLVHQFTEIGEHSFSGMGSAINRDVPPYMTVAGNYAMAYGINKTGLKRRGFSQSTIRALHKAYRVMIKSHLPREEATSQLKDLIEDHPEVERFVSFILSSTRGVVR
ncbi:MAG: acyl-ACP--UDP-N-acetylglucosamine O-acyltransferase [Gammaproteobacteria bacterium]|nr:acyl-ACP--UDP-N-acetylglucosamine O-acyltransferase [Gammaproteobacteria bacterium]